MNRRYSEHHGADRPFDRHPRHDDRTDFNGLRCPCTAIGATHLRLSRLQFPSLSSPRCGAPFKPSRVRGQADKRLELENQRLNSKIEEAAYLQHHSVHYINAQLARDPAAASAAVQAAGQLKTTDCAQIALLAVGFLAKKSVSLYDSHSPLGVC